MSPAATLLATWAAVYAYAGVFNVMLRARRPRRPEYVAFALMCFGLAVWTLGSALGVDATTRGEAAGAYQISLVGGTAAALFFQDFALRLVRLARPRAVLAGYAIGGIAIAAIAAGWVVSDERTPLPPSDWLGRGHSIALTLTPLGYALVVAVLGFASHGLLVVAGAARERRDLRPLVVSAALATLAAVYDVFAPPLEMPPLHLTEHFGLLPIMAVSALLMQRFAKASAELGERTAELRQSYGELRATQAELVRQEQLAAVGELSAVIAHEVRNPLAVIKNAHSSLRRGTLPARDRVVLLDIVDEEVDRLSRLTRDLLAYARPLNPEGRRIDLRALVWEAVDEAVAAGPAPVSVSHEDVGVPAIQGDPDLLARAFRNVVDNAVSAMEDGGRLVVRGRPARVDGEGWALVEVIDDGAGMDEATLAKATTPFFTTRPAGTGLGLAIVERVVRSHGGRLEVESAPGEGTTVRILLPTGPFEERRP